MPIDRRIRTAAALGCWLVAWLAGPAAAHSPIMACYDNGDGSVTCEAGFSDGSSATGAEVTVVTAQQRAIARGNIGADGTFTFPMPDDPDVEIHFVADGAHELTLFGDEIVPFEN